jgi:hypothetical protein
MDQADSLVLGHVVEEVVDPPRLGSCHSFLAVAHAGQTEECGTAVVLEHHGWSSALVDIAMVFAAAVVDAVGEVAAASSDRAQVVVSRDLARPASVVVEEVLALDVLEQEMLTHFPPLALPAAILLAVVELAEVLAVRAQYAAVVAVIERAVLWQRRRARRPGSRTMLISAPQSASFAFFLNAPANA